MAAKGKKKQRSKKNHKGKKQNPTNPAPTPTPDPTPTPTPTRAPAMEEDGLVATNKESNELKEFDLEAMERMLEEEEQTNDEMQKDNNDLDGDDDDKDEEDSDNDDDICNDENDEVATEDESEDEIHKSDEDEDENENEESDLEDRDEVVESNNSNEKNLSTPEGDENCTLDLRNLLAINSHQVNSRSLYKQQKQQKDDDDTTTICVSGVVEANDNYLLQKASEGCTQLLSALWNLETEKSDAGPMAILPTYCEIVTPRELPPPAPKKETKWEKFAKERGIAPKEKRSRKVWDEATQSWAYRTGYQKATSMDDPESWPIMEVKKNDDPFENPWQRARDAKKERIEKNVLNRMKNAEMGGVLERGTARRVMKAKKEARDKGRAGGNMDLKNFTTSPAGIPMDLVEGKQRGKSLTKMALLATQTSTASMGKFDKMREGEPERRKSMSGLKKRKYESATSESVVKAESRKSLKVLENVISGGGKAKDRAIRRGQYSKGETGHDYEFDDGLGPSTFKKKKGRAGIGKMKKITKKLAK